MMRMTQQQCWMTFVMMLIFVSVALADDGEDTAVTCGSVIKLTHVHSGVGKYFLFSEDIAMHGGSGQQIVTWMKGKPESTQALWMLRPANHNEDDGKREYPTNAVELNTCGKAAEPIKCGSIIRLSHLATKKNLHSHAVKSPLSNQQEVSAFGQGDFKGDQGGMYI